MSKFKDKVGESWFNILEEEFTKDYFLNLGKWITYNRKNYTIYPESEDIFKAYLLSPFDKTKVVIIGQDPYYNGQANGLAFGLKDRIGLNKPKQLIDVIWEEMERDVQFGMYLDFDYSLNWLANQGVLLLNTVLTVRAGKPKSHFNLGWEKFTKKSIYKLIKYKSNIVFLVWGNIAKEFIDSVNKYDPFNDNNHLYLYAPHPAKDLYNFNFEFKADYPNTFIGCNHFSKCNEFLKEHNIEKIIW